MTIAPAAPAAAAPDPESGTAAGGAARGRRRRSWLTSWPLGRAIVAVIALVGAGVLLYPTGATWFDDRRHDGAISGYARTLAGTPSEEITRELAAAHVYNDALPKTTLRDPYSASGAGAEETGAYDGQLAGPDGIMGVIGIGSIGVNLPIYHGVAADVLDRGAGHLPGSALPVGGAGTHSVLTTHSGVVGRELFTRLNKVHVGDTFTITVLNQTLTYQVDQIKTVLPSEIATLAPVPGEDYVTLITCTPIGVNSHRLLVRGHRVAGAETTTPAQIIQSLRHGGFPWWLVIAAGAVPAAVVLTAPLARQPRRRR